jgi:hypothetical protein
MSGSRPAFRVVSARRAAQDDVMAFPPIPTKPSTDRDEDHLLLLSIFHFILAGLGVLGLGFLMIHYTIMSTVFDNPHMWDHLKDKDGNPVPMPFNPSLFFNAFRWFYLFMGAWGIVSIIVNLVAGFRLRQWRSRTFLLFVAGFNCLNIPFGTVLGIFTIIVLTRASVRVRYEPNTKSIGF